MKQRIIGFDLARAYAIFGMYIVNFTFCFGSFREETIYGRFADLFIGNSTSIFIICAGMGVILMTQREGYSQEQKGELKTVILKRSWFLFGLGLLLYNWWPGDILHFYGGYMHIAAFILFIRRKYYLWLAVLAIVVYNALQFLIPVTTSWDLQTTRYADFWTPAGFLRNTFYNGWNSIFPWFAYFSLGMFLGRLDWHDKKTWKQIFFVGVGLLAAFKALRLFIKYDFDNMQRHEFYIKSWSYIMEDYFPANIPFMMITTGWAFMIIASCMYIGNKLSTSKLIKALAGTGQMTLSLYVLHMTVGVLILSKLTHKPYTGYPQQAQPVGILFILFYAILFFGISVLFSFLWSRKFKNGALETLMRKISKPGIQIRSIWK
ncbi:DUF418 domain-containing protein [Segetibacter aerophilus]|uniref:Membrane protein n=1 Tax=Segetibacter aerophilus TaxID=670293 RepID=A0A512BDH4_9BACT|nr:DUF418 domain-containing protein [Segetibacter aerophilus]GEO10018.1 membrane protein [Segetibacter aerophilus]